MADKNDVGSLVAGTISLAATTFSYLNGLGLLTVLFSVVFGAMLTYIVQSRTQKSVWKRESSLKKVDSIYGPLYTEINLIKQKFAGKEPFPRSIGYNSSTSSWDSIKGSYLYFLIPEHLRIKLDGFYDEVGEFNSNYVGLNQVIDRKLYPALRPIFGADLQQVSCDVKFKLPNSAMGSASTNLYWCILNNEDPLERAMKDCPGNSDYTFNVSAQRPSGSSLYQLGPKEPVLQAQWDDALKPVRQEIQKDPTVLKLAELASRISIDSSSLREELRKVIEEPWSI